ncbi:hypothetical protein TrLO_g14060 [Triparma laevis f. longispina]|uniref:Uncharacterized protein n=1 Tax=Triparma laevis f. longispina TaxID=1714387 RepID=A0A9W7FPK3_9STRA|nr:hypothetical protein TrLO_g14060 [Triparma laevis f. longispina]
MDQEDAITDVIAGLKTIKRLNPEQWWDLVGLPHPVGNLNMCLLQAVSQIFEKDEDAKELESLEVPDVGTLSLTTANKELESLYNSFLFLWDEFSKGAELEWKAWAENEKEGGGKWSDLATFVSTDGKCIAVIGRAEKRLVVAAARLLVFVLEDTGNMKLNPTAREAFNQLSNKT